MFLSSELIEQEKENHLMYGRIFLSECVDTEGCNAFYHPTPVFLLAQKSICYCTL